LQPSNTGKANGAAWETESSLDPNGKEKLKVKSQTDLTSLRVM